MSYYSIRAYSTISIQYEKPTIIFIEPGNNVFTVLTDDIDSFMALLESDGIRVDEVNKLDGADAHVDSEQFLKSQWES